MVRLAILVLLALLVAKEFGYLKGEDIRDVGLTSTLQTDQVWQRCIRTLGPGDKMMGLVWTLSTSPFAHCKLGDAISVFTATADLTSLETIWDVRSHEPHYNNEMTAYCSFDHPIVFVGKTKTQEFDLPLTINWYNCIYIGYERNARLEAQ